MRWLGALEGYYGPPYAHEARCDLVRWLGEHGGNIYVYAPKDDPLHRQRWREPYPDEAMATFAELVSVGREAGVDVAFAISPGLDWREGDAQVLVDKLRPFAASGCQALFVAWDDVPAGGAELGRAHASGVRAATEALDAQWITVPTDYALSEPTDYLRAFCDELPDEVAVCWTGPSVVCPTLTGAETRALADALGRDLTLWENFPVNDAVMRGVLHLGPYPTRDADVPAAHGGGVLFNVMHLPLASRIGLECGMRFWRDPSGDREATWREVVAGYPGLGPLAKACRSWADHPGPDEELAAWAASDHDALTSYLDAGCRDALSDALTAELEPWLDVWEREAQVMRGALAMSVDGRPVEVGFMTMALWLSVRRRREQVFGIRSAGYPVTGRVDGQWALDPRALVVGENLTDRLCRRVLMGQADQTSSPAT